MSKKLLVRGLSTLLAAMVLWGMSLCVMAAEPAYEAHPVEECPDATYTYVDGPVQSGFIGSTYHYRVCSVCNKAYQEVHTVTHEYVDENSHTIKCSKCGYDVEHFANEVKHIFRDFDGNPTNVCRLCHWVNPTIKIEEKNEEPQNSINEEDIISRFEENPYTNLGLYQENVRTEIDSVISRLSQSQADLDSLKVTGVNLDTGSWHSFNKNTFQKIEELTQRGIPVTLNFYYKGLYYCVTIPAGANVSELCDESGWCGFCNLGSHYGYRLPDSGHTGYAHYAPQATEYVDYLRTKAPKLINFYDENDLWRIKEVKGN